ncbi:hypothetical protein GCM10023189_00890 [Nibrella saemangeumensis]|uniref:VWFA domain-containing protein n=1 Tax=Nibrella saemangeumensis TaxID=1084526 RepID=A0ABP8M7Y3_9BACT
MNWLYRFSITEWSIVALFLLLYGLYFFRTFRLARQLGTSSRAVIPKFFLRSSYLLLLLMALLGPSFGEAERSVTTQGRDIYLLVDISKSMDAADVAPSRLERIKYDIQQLTDTLAADRFGLILFSTDAFVLSPLTSDHDAFNRMLHDASTSLSPSGGTDLCSALELAREKLVTDPTTQQSAKAIVLFSDGEDFGTCDRSALSRLRTYAIPLFTVGIGTESGGTIRKGRDFVRDDQRRIVRTRLDRETLQRLARDGRGQYIEAAANSQYITDLAGALHSLQGRTIDQRLIAVSTNKYYYFLAAALLLITIDIVVTVRTFSL